MVICILSHCVCHLLHSTVADTLSVFNISSLIFDSVSHDTLKFPLSFCSTKTLCEVSLHLIVGLFLISAHSGSKLVLEAIDTLCHLVLSIDRQHVALVLTGFVHANIVITTLQFLSGVHIEACTHVFQLLSRRFYQTLFAVRSRLFIDVERHLIEARGYVVREGADDGLCKF